MSEKVTKFTRLRDWLERNKVFFEVVAAILLSIMSFFVSINANQIASYQNDLVKEQNQLIKDENQPIFHFNFSPIDNDNLDSSERIEIYNNGEKALYFKVETYVFCNIKFRHPYVDEFYRASFYHTDYYNETSTGSFTGLIKSLDSPGFLTSLQRLNYTELSYLQNQSNFEQVRLTRFVRITYTDIFNENHNVVYLVSEEDYIKLTEAEKAVFEHNLEQPYALYLD